MVGRDGATRSGGEEERKLARSSAGRVVVSERASDGTILDEQERERPGNQRAPFPPPQTKPNEDHHSATLLRKMTAPLARARPHTPASPIPLPPCFLSPRTINILPSAPVPTPTGECGPSASGSVGSGRFAQLQQSGEGG